MSCDLGTVAAGASATVPVTVTLRVIRPGTVSTTASVAANEPDPVVLNNNDTETSTVEVSASQNRVGH